MTEKQFKYICDICPQTIGIGLVKKGKYKYEIKPYFMKEKMMALPQSITQNFIEYGKAWKSWCIYDDFIFRKEITAEKAGFFADIEDLEEEKDKAWKKMREISNLLCKQLNEIKWEELL